VDATSYLSGVAKAMKSAKLEAVLIGNAAAALQGAPVTTMDLDFFYRDTATNRKKLEVVAASVGAKLTRPFPELSSLYRLDYGLADFHVDFLAVAAGVKSLASLRSRATPVAMEGAELLVASLVDVIQSKRAAGRPKDKAVLDVLEKTLNEIQAQTEQG
jgi:hypothetical protein